MSLLQATGVIMGANLGTTVTTQLITLNLTDFIPYFICVGTCIIVCFKKDPFTKLDIFYLALDYYFLGFKWLKQP